MYGSYSIFGKLNKMGVKTYPDRLDQTQFGNFGGHPLLCLNFVNNIDLVITCSKQLEN